MPKLNDGMLLYHGSYLAVPEIDLGACKVGKDFGRGFYVTSSYDQAHSFVRLSVKRQIKEGALSPDHGVGAVSVYRLHLADALSLHMFEHADEEWLHFVAGNRRLDLFPGVLDAFREVDIVGGKIANDRTARTLQLYVAGGYGEPGTPEADAIAIQTLLPNRLDDQFCFRTDAAVRALEFVRSDHYDALA
ncbi:DUF3990 domain-containing protein [Arabiibacter massiliensis]|uniref:DUF3990 domain-containing protein n=1 Tax=Arabiibacter massiliensis TaxID=1870985 RepID=UPI00117BBECC|nr:DUF3990 domain-containing protein [Arabiibacter massiliensis]